MVRDERSSRVEMFMKENSKKAKCTVKVPTNGLMEQSITVSGLIMKEADQVLKLGLMGKSKLEISNVVNYMARVFQHPLMVKSMRASITKAIDTAKASTQPQMATNMMVSGKRILVMVKELRYSRAKPSMKVILFAINTTDTEFTLGRMVINMLANLGTVVEMVREL